MVMDPVETFAFYVVAILVLFTVLAAIAEWSMVKTKRRLRDEARAHARAKRMEGADQSDASEDFSWQERSRV